MLREEFRVLKPGGRFAVSDIVVWGDFPETYARVSNSGSAAFAGALRDTEYIDKLQGAGFSQLEIEPTRIYDTKDATSQRPRR